MEPEHISETSPAPPARPVLGVTSLFGVLLGLLLVVNGLVWLVSSKESLLFVFWSGNYGKLAWIRAGMALLTGGALMALPWWSSRRRVLWSGLLLLPGIVWSLADAVSVWQATGKFGVELGWMAILPTSLALMVAIALPWVVRLRQWSRVSAVERRGKLVSLVRLAVAGALLLGMLLHHIMAMGATDYRRKADTAVVFGATVYASGKPSPLLHDRVMTGVRLYHEGRVRQIVMTGAIDERRGQSEPVAMRRLAVREGVPLKDVIIDEQGVNTAASIRNLASMDRRFGLGRLLLVSNDHHTSRIRLACHRLGLACYTVPAELRAVPLREPYYLMRELAGFVYYALTFR